VADARTIGVDVGGTKIAAGVIDREGAIGARLERPTPTGSQEDLLAALDEMVDELRDESVVAIGFGLPSTIDQRSGRAISSVHIPLADLDFRDRMRERLSLPVGIDNDANAATLAEWQIGAGRGTRHMVMLTLGTGVGGGLVLDGKMYRGAVGAAAELGHMVLSYGGEPCGGTCAGHGHFEQFASGRAADRAALEILGEPATARELVTAAWDGNQAALDAMHELGRRLGAGIGTLINVFDPEVVVLGGGFSIALDLLLHSAREVVEEEALPPGRTSARIVPAELGRDAGVIGAGLVGFEALDG
jgi:glucokinase